MAIERINSAFDTPALKQEFETFVAGMEESQTAVVNLFNTIKGYKGATLKTISDETNKLETSLLKTVSTTDKLNRSLMTAERAKAQFLKTEQQVVKLITEEDKATQQNIKTKEAASKLEVTLTKNKQALAKAHEQEKSALDKNNNAYEILKKQYTTAANESKRLGAALLAQANGDNKVYQQLIKTDQAYINATKDAQTYWKQLDLLEVKVGQNQRRVGQYERANAGLSNSINQLSRELPAFANSVQTGFMAISNNLPIFFDEIKKINEENKALAENGQKPVSALKQLSASFFSVQTALSVGVTLLTVYGAKLIELVAGLFDSEAAMKKQREEAIKLNEEYSKLNNTIEEFYDTFKNGFEDKSASKRLNMAQAEDKARSELLEKEKAISEQRAYQAQTALDNANNKDLEGFLPPLDELEKRYSKAFMIYKNFLETKNYEGKRVDDEDLASIDTYLKSNLQRTEADFKQRQKIEDEYFESFFENANKQREIDTYNAELRRKEIQETAKTNAELVINANSMILNDERSTEKQRIASIRRIAEAQKASSAADLVAIQNDPSSEESQKRTALLAYNKDVKKITADAAKQIYDVELEFANRRAAALKSIEDTRLNDLISVNKEIVSQEENSVGQRIVAANKISDAKNKQIEDEYKFQRRLLDQKAAADGEYEQLEADKNSKLAAAAVDSWKTILEIQESEFQKTLDLRDKQLAELATRQAAGQLALAQSYSDDVFVFGDNLRKKKISYESYQRSIQDLDKKYAIEQMRLQAQTLKNSIDGYADIEMRVSEIKEKIFDTEKQYAAATDDVNKNALQAQLALYKKDLEAFMKVQKLKGKALEEYAKLIADIEKLIAGSEGDIAKQQFEAAKKAFNNFVSTVMEVSNLLFDRRKVQIEDLDIKQQKAYEDEVKRISNLNISDSERADKLKILEAQRAVQKAENDRKLRKIEVERARFEKAASIISIIQSTAQAVAGALAQVKTLGPIAGVLAASYGILGAAQLARVIATPLPHYEKGTESAKGGWAITDEKGPELYIEPGGKSYLGDNQGPVMRYVKPGTKIIPADEINESLNRAMMADTVRQLQMVAGYKKQSESDHALNEIKDAILLQTDATIREMRRNKKGATINNIIDLGWSSYIQKKTFNA